MLLALALRLDAAGLGFGAGFVLSLSAIKFHLFLLLPLLVITQGKQRVLAGLTVGAAALEALSFIAAG